VSNFPDSRNTHPGNQAARDPWQPVTPVYSAGNIPHQPIQDKRGSKGVNGVPIGGGGGGGKKRFRAVFILLAVLIVLAAGYYGIIQLRDRQVMQFIAPYKDVYGPNIYINDVPLSGLSPQTALDRLKESIQNRINGWTLSITYRGHEFIKLNYGNLGIRTSEQELYPLLNDAWILTHSGSIHDQKAAVDRLLDNEYRLSTAENEISGEELRSILRQITPYVNRDPVDAKILAFQPDNEQPFTFLEEEQGARLDVESEERRILSMAVSGVSGVLELTPEVIFPSVTKVELERTVALRSSVATSISASSPENRNHNIRISFSKINGTILKPGQTFSFNDVVGPRTLKAGFAEALEYVYGDLVTGVGGGVCQASTTLYQAALTAGMSIVKRTPHSDKVDYTEMGQDATVYLSGGREIDFKFTNSSPGDIYLTAHVKTAKNNSKRLVAEIRIYGISLGEGASYRLRSDVVEVLTPPETKKLVVDMTGLIVTYEDEQKLKTRAQDGYVIETYLEKYVNGILVEQPKLISSDTFRAKPAEYWVGNTPRKP